MSKRSRPESLTKQQEQLRQQQQANSQLLVNKKKNTGTNTNQIEKEEKKENNKKEMKDIPSKEQIQQQPNINIKDNESNGNNNNNGKKPFPLFNIKDKSNNNKLLTNFTKNNIKHQKQLTRQFYRKQVVDLARLLLGKIIIRKTQTGYIKAVIVQTQAYKAPEDQACHAKNNHKTEKTKYFWLDGGYLYIYTIYMPTNICLNVVAGLEGQPQAVLIRAIQPIQGLEIMKEHRGIKSPKNQDLCNGPGKVGQSLLVKKEEMNGIDLVANDQFKIVDGGINQGQFTVGVSRRVNIDYAGEWIYKPWRFYVEGNTYVSKVVFKQPEVKKKGKKAKK